MRQDLPTPRTLLTADLPGCGGRIKEQPEDFEVEEISAYQPAGSGDFLYLWIEKRDMGAEFFLRAVARCLQIPFGEVGIAGMKDRRAVTRQWVSVPAAVAERLPALEGAGIRVLTTSRHVNKLKPGHLHGNRFRILIRAAEAERVSAILDVVRAQGLPNYYGAQRFGRDGETLRIGWGLLAPEPGAARKVRNPFLKKLSLSAVQSELFNRYLARRVVDGLLRRVLSGDVLAKWPFGGMFTAEDAAREQARLDAREIVPAGPIFGRKTFPARGEAAERETAILADAQLRPDSFAGFGKLVMGTRRHNLIYIDDLSVQSEPEGVRLSFSLPAGSYATVLLEEVMKTPLVNAADESE